MDYLTIEKLVGVLTLFLCFGLVPAIIADQKNRNFWRWWLYGAAIFPVAFVHANLVKPIKWKQAVAWTLVVVAVAVAIYLLILRDYWR